MRWLLITLGVMGVAIIAVRYWHIQPLWAGIGGLLLGTVLDKVIKK